MAFDTIIAGAGIIGASIAWRLAQSGFRVLLLDQARMGGEASSAGAGMLAPGGEFAQPSPWNDFALESLRLYPAFIAELEDETGCHIDFQRLGAVELALSDHEWQALEDRARRQSALGIPSCALTVNDLRQHVPLARHEVAGALFYPQDALVDPRDLMTALRAACVAKGVEISEGVPVIAVRPRSDRVVVETSGTVLEAPSAVLAAGAWTSEIVVENQRLPRAFPVRGHLVGFAMEPHSLGPILRRGHTYLLQRSGGFTVAGTSSEEVGFDRTLNADLVSDIHSRATAVLPSLAVRQPIDAWIGFRPAVDRDQPVIGRASRTALWLAYGHYRNGILMAPATALRIAKGLIANSEMDSFAPPGKP